MREFIIGLVIGGAAIFGYFNLMDASDETAPPAAEPAPTEQKAASETESSSNTPAGDDSGTNPPPPGDGPAAYIIAPADGASVSSPVTVIFGLKGFGVAPAGLELANTGHHHLIIDAELPAMDAPIPANETYRHFGGGQTQASVELAPGEHKLQLLLGDWQHIPHDPPVMSDPITITVE